MDARSNLLNTEMGIIVDCPPLAAAVTEFFNTATLPEYAYRVTLKADGAEQGSAMQWQATEHGKPVTYNHDPGATTSRRVEVQMLKLLPLESLL
jgi:putative cardiolipin synthase